MQTSADEALADALRLSLTPGVGPRLRKALLDAFGTASAVFAAAPADVRRVPGIGSELTRRIATARDEIDVQAELDLCEAHGIRIISDACDEYPGRCARSTIRRVSFSCGDSCCRKMRWPWPSSARGTPRTMACHNRNAWPAAWPARG